MKKQVISFWILLIVVFFGFTNSVRAQVYHMDDSVYDSMAYKDFDLSHSKLDNYDINDSNIKIVNDVNPLTFVINNNNKEAITYEANLNDEKPYLLKLMYKNVANVGLRSIDVNVYMTKVVLSDFWENGTNYNANGVAFACVADSGLFIGTRDGSSYLYSARQEVSVTIEILWSDTHTVVDLPFLSIQSDIDINTNNSTNKSLEKWKAVSGYIGDYYIFNSSKLVQDASDAWYTTGVEISGVDSYIKSGVYAPTVNGKFSSIFYEGICASKIGIAMQTFTSPSKSSNILGLDNSNKNQVDSLSDKIVYTLNQKFGELYVSVFVPYTSFSISDTLDSNLIYESAKVILNNGNSSIDITNNSQYGALSYNENTRTVQYNFNPTWLSTNANYKGQTITMEITTSLNTINRNFINTAYTTLDDIDFPSNQVETSYIKKMATYKYVSGTDGRELPDEVISTSGAYKITDNNEYLVGEEVKRSDNIAIGTTYKVYENGKLVGSWILKSWNKDTLEMDEDGVEFIGYWEYIVNPQTFDNIFIYMTLFLVSMLALCISIKLFKKSYNK